MALQRSISTKKDRGKLSMQLRTRRFSSSTAEQELEEELEQELEQELELENSESSEDEIANPTQPSQRQKRKFT